MFFIGEILGNVDHYNETLNLLSENIERIWHKSRCIEV